MENSLPGLRQRAEGLASKQSTAAQASAALSAQALQSMLHELQVHQIELEMQNEALRYTQTQLDAAGARYFDLYDLALVGYCTVRADGIVVESNFMACTMLGLTRSELANRPLQEMIVSGFRSTYALCSQALQDLGAAQECELQMRKKDTSTVWVQLKIAAAVDMLGAPAQRVVLNDITQRKQYELALHLKNQELDAARMEAVNANRAKADFLSNMSHELRSPLNTILGFAQLMAMDAAAQSKMVRMHFGQSAEPFCLMADRSRLRQVLLNLLANAVQYNRLGGTVELYCRARPGQRLRIAVQDTGEVLTTEKMDQLFQPFNRLGRESTAQQGTGVGLALSKKLVEMMGGTIGVQSTVGVGSTFWIELNQCADPANGTFLNTLSAKGANL
jgi:PAS domain S-box-containing protein